MSNAHSEHKLEIYPNGAVSEQNVLANYVVCRKSFDAKNLVETVPIGLSHPYKKLVYDIACPPNSKHSGNIVFTRYNPIPLSSTFPAPGSTTQFEMKEDVFQYTPNNDSNTVEWYVNFADTHLFVAYGGPLFAQDEMQAAEHPAMGHLKEALIKLSKENRSFAPLTRENNAPLPCLIRGIERRCWVATDKNEKEGRPFGLYGNNFARFGKEAVRLATHPINPPTITNFIAMAALGGGQGEYSSDQIVDTFTTAFTSFTAAKIESILSVNGEQIGNSKPKVVIHTGNWGTGAFGGNKALMAIIQLAAAQLAGVDRLVYHTFNAEGTQGYKEGYQIFKEELLKKEMSTHDLLLQLEKYGFKWGMSDGN